MKGLKQKKAHLMKKARSRGADAAGLLLRELELQLLTHKAAAITHLLKMSGRHGGSAAGFMVVQCVWGHGFTLYRRPLWLSSRTRSRINDGRALLDTGLSVFSIL